VFWRTMSETSSTPSGAWPLQTAAQISTLVPGPSKLGNAKQRTDVYVNLNSPDYGLKLRGSGVFGTRQFELKIRNGSEGKFEDWEKCVCEDTTLTPEVLDRHAIRTAVGTRSAEVIDLLDSAAERAIQVAIEKVRVQVEGGGIKMEAVEMSVGAGGNGLWRSVCVEGIDCATVRSYVGSPFLADIGRNGMEPLAAGPFGMGYPEFISSVVLAPT
jgi:hypothetical protein